MHIIYPVILLSDITDHYPIDCFVTRDPNTTISKIKQDNYYRSRDTGQFNCDGFKMELQEVIKPFLNTNEHASSDQIDL